MHQNAQNSKVSLPWNPQPNAILERIHQALGDALRTFELDDREIDPDEEDPFAEYLSNAAYAIRSSFHATHGHSPGELVLGRNMFLPVSTPVDWEEIKKRKQKAIAKSNQRENAKRIGYQYKKGDWVTAKRPGIIRKLCVPKEGPFQVVKHHSNGTVAYEREPFVEERVNIRRINPYKWKNDPPQ